MWDLSSPAQCSVAKTCPTLCDPHGLWAARLHCPWDPPGKDTRGLPDPGIEPWSPVSPVLQVGSLPAEPSGSPIAEAGVFPDQACSTLTCSLCSSLLCLWPPPASPMETAVSTSQSRESTPSSLWLGALGRRAKFVLGGPPLGTRDRERIASFPLSLQR